MMSEIEKLASEHATWHYVVIRDYSTEEDLKAAYLAGAAALLDLIRERMPGETRHKETDKEWETNIRTGMNEYRKLMVDALNSLTENNPETEQTT